MTQESRTHELQPPATPRESGAGELISVIGEALVDKKAENVVVLDVRELTTLTDYFVICHGNSDVQIKALAESVTEQTRERLDEKVWRKEGMDTRRWVVLDYINVVVHIFNRDTREHYGMERMWNDARVTTISDYL